jgi:hypothetical protein
MVGLTKSWLATGCHEVPTFISLLDKLASPPMYYLPRAMVGDSRHPIERESGPHAGNRFQCLDCFLSRPKDKGGQIDAYIGWPRMNLTTAEKIVLNRLCSEIDRSSIADCDYLFDVVDQITPTKDHAIVDLAIHSKLPGALVRRLAVSPNVRGEQLFYALLKAALFRLSRSQGMPQGAVWIKYRLPPDFLLVREQYEAREREPLAFGPILFRFAIEGSTRADQRPSITDSVILAEVMRRAVISRYSDLHGGTATTRLAGKDPAGVGKRTGHDHPFYLPVAADDDPRIIALDVWLPGGCTHAEYRAVTSVRRLISRDWRFGEIRLHFVGPVSPPTGKVWETVTPVVLDRFPKLRGSGPAKDLIDSPASQLRSMLDRRLSCSCTVTVWPDEQPVRFGTSTAIGQRSFQRRRSGDRPVYPTCSATLAFEEAVDGPIVLGRLAHFGLGQFRPSAS